MPKLIYLVLLPSLLKLTHSGKSSLLQSCIFTFFKLCWYFRTSVNVLGKCFNPLSNLYSLFIFLLPNNIIFSFQGGHKGAFSWNCLIFEIKTFTSEAVNCENYTNLRVFKVSIWQILKVPPVLATLDHFLFTIHKFSFIGW